MSALSTGFAALSDPTPFGALLDTEPEAFPRLRIPYSLKEIMTSFESWYVPIEALTSAVEEIDAPSKRRVGGHMAAVRAFQDAAAARHCP